MANVNILFNGKEFLLSCEDGQEEHLQELSIHLNEKFDNLKKTLGNIGESKLLLITSITTMDEFFETKKKIDEKIKELNILTAKFKELKNLVYEYKDKKEQEIKRLDQEQINLKNEIDQNKDEYEKLIDTTTNEIENFLKKASTDNSVQ